MPQVPLSGAGEPGQCDDRADKETRGCEPVLLQDTGQPSGFSGKTLQWWVPTGLSMSSLFTRHSPNQTLPRSGQKTFHKSSVLNLCLRWDLSNKIIVVGLSLLAGFFFFLPKKVGIRHLDESELHADFPHRAPLCGKWLPLLWGNDTISLDIRRAYKTAGM